MHGRNTLRSRAETNSSFAGTLYLTLLMGSKETNTNTCSKLHSNVYSHGCCRVRRCSGPGRRLPGCHPSQCAPVSAFFSHYCKMPGPISSSPHDHVQAGWGGYVQSSHVNMFTDHVGSERNFCPCQRVWVRRHYDKKVFFHVDNNRVVW